MNSKSHILWWIETLVYLLTQYCGVPLSYNYSEWFIFCPSFITKNYSSVHSIKNKNQPQICKWTCNSCILCWHNIIGWHYWKSTLNCCYSIHILSFFTKNTFYLAHIGSKFIINGTYFNEFQLLCTVLTHIMGSTILQYPSNHIYPSLVIFHREKTFLLVYIISKWIASATYFCGLHLLFTIFTQYYGIPLSYSSPKLFICCPSLVTYCKRTLYWYAQY